LPKTADANNQTFSLPHKIFLLFWVHNVLVK